MKRIVIVALVLALLSTFAACGGGGGGGGFIGAALVSMRASPTNIDTGDRTLVRVEISEVNENGISLKIRFPEQLEYVPDSAFLLVGDNETDLSPTVNALDDNKRYLVFYLEQDDFGAEGEDTGVFEVQLEAKDDLSEGSIEVDADVDDPLISNDVEFDLENPEFLAEDEVVIDVEG